MRSTLMMTFALACAATGCREEPGRTAPPPGSAPPVTEPQPAPPPSPPSAARTTTAPTRGDRPADTRPEVDVAAPVLLGLDDVAWRPGPPSLPEGAQFAVLEGAPPFAAGKTFTLLAKLPKSYTIPPHTHLVTERVTVLQGALSFGHGETLDRAAATKVKAGGLVLIPADHAHYAFTTDRETVIALSGVGPWEIIYVDPENDPRPTPARKPDKMIESPWDAPTEAKIIQPGDVQFVEPPAGMLPPGAKLAVLEGDPDQPRMFTLRLLMPKGYKIPAHTHPATGRFMVVAGALSFAMGDAWDDKRLKPMRMGSVGIVPKGQAHYLRATSAGTVMQVTGVGPHEVTWSNPADMPAK